MTSEDELFRKLRQWPFEKLWAERKNRMDNSQNYDFEELLKDAGWTVDEFNAGRKVLRARPRA